MERSDIRWFKTHFPTKTVAGTSSGSDYDVIGQVTKARENGATSGVGVLATYEYDDQGRRTKLTYGNGVVTDYAYDGASRLTDLDHNLPGSGDDESIDFSYNPAGQITSRAAANDNYAFVAHFNMDVPARDGAQL
ncbi:MAG: hypothetical protein AAGD92_16070 [Pseudomonadota bacterium]